MAVVCVLNVKGKKKKAARHTHATETVKRD